MRFQRAVLLERCTPQSWKQPVWPPVPVRKAVTSQNRLLLLISEQDFRSGRLSLEGLVALGELPVERRRDARFAPSGMSKPPGFGTGFARSKPALASLLEAP
jgi:hypothetical protein